VWRSLFHTRHGARDRGIVSEHPPLPQSLSGQSLFVLTSYSYIQRVDRPAHVFTSPNCLRPEQTRATDVRTESPVSCRNRLSVTQCVSKHVTCADRRLAPLLRVLKVLGLVLGLENDYPDPHMSRSSSDPHTSSNHILTKTRPQSLAVIPTELSVAMNPS
jgi:hypothetical protein